MLKKNQSNLYLILRKRNKKIKKNFLSYDLVIAKKRKHNYFFVIEKLGSLDFRTGLINLNFFRLVFWISFNPGCSIKFQKFLQKYLIK